MRTPDFELTLGGGHVGRTRGSRDGRVPVGATRAGASPIAECVSCTAPVHAIVDIFKRKPVYDFPCPQKACGGILNDESFWPKPINDLARFGYEAAVT